MKYIIPAAILIGIGAAVGLNAIEAKHAREAAQPAKPMKMEVAAKVDDKVKAKSRFVEPEYDPDPRLHRVADMMAQRGWICGRVVTVSRVKGDRTDVIHFLVKCFETYEKDGEKRGTMRIYFVTAAPEVVQALLDNEPVNRMWFVKINLMKREEWKP